MKKYFPINFRPFLVISIFVLGGIAAAYIYAISRPLGIALACIYFVVTAVIITVAAVKFARNHAKLRTVLTFSIALILCVAAFGVSASTFDNWTDGSDLGGQRSVTGRVCAVDTRSGNYKIDIDGLTIDGKSVRGVMRLSVSSSDVNLAEIAECGDRLEFSAFVTAVELVDGYSVNGTAYRTDIRFYATVRSESVRVEFGKPKFTERFTTALRTLLVANMGDKYGNIAYSMLTGDKHALDSEISDYYSAAGLGHIMAVSGLHIGFLAVLLNFLLSRIDKRVRFGIVSAVLIGYAVIAGLSPSVVRAVIMTVISMFSLLIGARRDLLSALCCAFSFILAVKPLYLFEVGFLLSFGAIFGIAAFSGGISRFLTKRKVNYKLSDALGTAAAVNIGIFPSQIFFFQSIQVFAFIVNTVLIPYISVAFLTLIPCIAIGSIPYCGAVLLLPKYLLIPIDYIAQGISAIPHASATVYSSVAIFLAYPVMFCASGFLMIKRGRAAVVLASIAACSAFTFVSVPPPDKTITVIDSSSTESLVIDGDAFVIGYMGNEYAVYSALRKNRIKTLSAIYLFRVSNSAVTNILSLANDIEIGAVYGFEFDTAAERLIENGINYNVFTDGLPVSAARVGGEAIGFEYKGVLFAADGTDERALIGYDAVRVKTIVEPMSGVTYLCNTSEEVYGNVLTLDRGEYTFPLIA